MSEHRHRWVNPMSGGRVSHWAPMFNDPVCSVCGNHPDEPDAIEAWATTEAKRIVYQIGGSTLAYHTAKRREKELAHYLKELVTA